MDNFPEVVNTALLSTFIFCDSLDSLILIFLHWPSNPLTFKFNRFRIFISIPFHVTLYLFLICVITFRFDSIPSWIIFSRILLSGDVELNPGDKHFTFLNWNLNSLAKDNFGRAQLLEAHNSIFDYDLISICETSLDDTIEIPEVLIEDYAFVNFNNPNNTKHGGVGLFYKNNLPIKVRNDLSFDESIVVELRFGRKKVLFTVLYKSPTISVGTPAFTIFLLNLENLYLSTKKECPYAMYFMDDFNCHSQHLWPAGDTNSSIV